MAEPCLAVTLPKLGAGDVISHSRDQVASKRSPGPVAWLKWVQSKGDDTSANCRVCLITHPEAGQREKGGRGGAITWAQHEGPPNQALEEDKDNIWGAKTGPKIRGFV